MTIRLLSLALLLAGCSDTLYGDKGDATGTDPGTTAGSPESDYILASFANGNFLVDVGPENLTIVSGTAESDFEADGYGYTYLFDNVDSSGITVRTDSYFMLVCKSEGSDHELLEGQVGSTNDGYLPAGYVDCWTWYTNEYAEG